MPAFTKGPWTLHRGFGDWGMGVSHVIAPVGVDETDIDNVIADLPSVQPYCMGASRQEKARAAEQLANAALIASAPDLVEALQKLLAASERHIFGDECLKEREAARTALSKALGEGEA